MYSGDVWPRCIATKQDRTRSRVERRASTKNEVYSGKDKKPEASRGSDLKYFQPW